MQFNTFPFKTTFSLSNLIGFYEIKAVEDTALGNFAKEVLAKLKDRPELRGPIVNDQIIEKNIDLIELILSIVFSPVLREDELIAVINPYGQKAYACTSRLKNMIPKDRDYTKIDESITMEEVTFRKIINAYAQILSQCYGVTIPIDYPITVSMKDRQNGLEKHYKMIINPKFMEIKINGELPELTEKDLVDLKNNIFNLSLWQKLIPPDKFEFEGFIIVRFEDITEQEALSRLKYNLLEKDTIESKEKFQAVQNNLRSLFGLTNLKVGLASIYKNDRDFYSYHQGTDQSFVMRLFKQSDSDKCELGSTRGMFESIKSALVFPDLELENPLGEVGQKLLKQGIRNLKMVPLFDDGEFIGILELGSSIPNELNASYELRVKAIRPLFEIAIKRAAQETDNQVRAIIKEEYTAIHPSVEWKFTQAAFRLLEQKRAGIDRPEAPEIIFEDVYPLYAAYDVRSSSILRNNAIAKDLDKQLELALRALREINSIERMMIMDEAMYRAELLKKEIAKGILTDDGEAVMRLLKSEIEPLFLNFGKKNLAYNRFIDEYYKAIDDELGIIYEQRKAFDDSVARINEELSMFMEKEQEWTQKVFPHYYEKYNTDGLEYNIYLGKSLVKNRSFHKIYLENLRLWQLVSSCKIAYLNNSLRDQLELPLELTHLILVHSKPLSVRFRKDEKKFDVDGAYNVRYEIVKKRIDKAVIKGSKERLTQPNKIAVVYSNDEDKAEFLKYFEFLQYKGYLEKGVEELILEPLQGVSGLSALRVAVKLRPELSTKENSTESLIKELELSSS